MKRTKLKKAEYRHKSPYKDVFRRADKIINRDRRVYNYDVFGNKFKDLRNY